MKTLASGGVVFTRMRAPVAVGVPATAPGSTAAEGERGADDVGDGTVVALVASGLPVSASAPIPATASSPTATPTPSTKPLFFELPPGEGGKPVDVTGEAVRAYGSLSGRVRPGTAERKPDTSTCASDAGMSRRVGGLPGGGSAEPPS
jgi:hypothetical protein